MRVLFGIILGAVLTIGGAYLYDSNSALRASTEPGTSAPAQLERPLVNWEIVGSKWSRLTERARSEWNRLVG